MFGRRKEKSKSEEGSVSTNKLHSSSVISIVTSIISIVSVVAAVYFYVQSRHPQNEKNAEADELKQVVESVGKLMELPVNETPTLATVTDKEKLSGQAFFQKSENGDKVLIYETSGKAILYRPSTKKIVDVTTVSTQKDTAAAQTDTKADSQQPASPPTPDTSEASPANTETSPVQETVKIALLNGSAKVGVTQGTEDSLKKLFPEGVEVVAKEKAAKNDYQGVLVIDVTHKASDKAKTLAQSLSGTVAPMPEGESALNGADIVVIIGNSGTASTQNDASSAHAQ